VPPLVAFGGTPLLFTLFSTAFLVAATTVFLLPERRGESL
jgi:major facilitator family permease